METLEFTQDELKYVITSLNHLVKTGGLMLGDIAIIAPIAEKIRLKMKTEPEAKESLKIADLAPKN